VTGAAHLSCTFLTLAAVLIARPAAPSEGQPQDATALDAGASIERRVALGEEHRYRITLAAGQYAEVVVEQRGIDVVVQARREGATDHVEFQEEVRRNGQERVEVAADDGATYILAIAPSHGIYSGTYAIRVATRRAATDADRSMYEARRLRTSALAMEKAGRFNEARPAFERAITISESVRGPDNVFTGMLLYDLVGSALETRDDVRAELLQRRALTIFDKAWGDGHPYSAMARTRTAVLLHNAGQRALAEALLRPATQLIERTLGTEHAWFATCLRVHASIRYTAGDFDASEQLYLRAMAILERVGANETPSYAAGLNNLGLVYMEKKDPARAEDYYQRALALGQRLEGTDSHHISVYLQNLGVVARSRKEYAKAFDYTTRALVIRQRIVGPEHVDIAPLLNNLASLYRLTGDVPTAADTFFRALRIWEKAVGPYHRGTLAVVGNIARLYAGTGELAKAISFQRRADAIIEKQLELNLAVGSERQKLGFVNSVAERTDRTISLHLNGAPGDADAGALAALVVLQRKGRVLDAMTDTFSAVRRSVADGNGRAVLDQLNSTTARLARLALNGANDGSTGERQRAIAELEEEKERLEEELAGYSSELRARIQPVTLDAVQAALPEGAALLEFAIFRPFDSKAETSAEAYGPARYAAYVVRKNAPPQGVDLGPAAPIDGAIEALRQAVRDRTRTDVSTHARAVHDVLMRPLRTAYGDVSQLLVSPDGALNLVPFEALVDEQGRYLIERFSISYLTSGRDLLRQRVSRLQGGPPVIVADPSYGEPAPGPAGRVRRKQPRSADQERGVTTAADPSALYFAPLANTAAEAHAIRRFFPDALLLTGPRATKAAVARLDAPRLLHIASHGFFLVDGAGVSGARIENPLLRSGIALAGANLGHDIRGDGILTALEASGLNLAGTRLVTLSACDTGVGEVRNGEGVYGLRRAFVLAGTESLVMSLWPLSDYIARATMVSYYAGLRDGLGRGEALRQAKLSMIKRKGRQHPYYWASFIQSGDWSSLDGKR